MPASWAMRGRCRPALVEPPVQATTRAAFSKRFAGADVAGADVLFDQVHHRLAGGFGILIAAFVRGGAPEELGSARPIASDTQAMVLAVNWPPQAPADRAGDTLQNVQLGFVMVPFADGRRPRTCPARSDRGRVFGRRRTRPGRIDPPYRNTDGTFRRIIAIIMPGRDLSQPARPTSAS